MSSSPPIRLSDDPGTPGRSRLVLSGRVTVAAAAELHRAAVAVGRQGRDVTVDCGAAEYLDVSAVQVLMALRRAVADHGRTWEVVGVSEVVREDFRLVGFDPGVGR